MEGDDFYEIYGRSVSNQYFMCLNTSIALLLGGGVAPVVFWDVCALTNWQWLLLGVCWLLLLDPSLYGLMTTQGVLSSFLEQNEIIHNVASILSRATLEGSGANGWTLMWSPGVC